MSTVPVPEGFDWAAVQERLRARAESSDAPPAWLPEDAGDEIVGLVVDVNPSVHTKHGPVPVVTLQGPAGGHRCVWLIHTVLRRGFERANVQLGEAVLVRYLGPVDPDSGGQPYHDYRVVVDRSSSSSGPDWSAIAAAHDDGEPADVPAPEPPPAAGDAPLGAAPPAAAADDDIPF